MPTPRGGAPRRAPLALARAATLVTLAACRSDAVGPGDPVRLVALGSQSPEAVAGGETEGLLAVRVETGSGDPVEGARLRFQPTDPGGIVDPPIGESGPDGVVRGTFVAGLSAGEVRVRADLPDRPAVRALVYRVRVRPAGVFQVETAGGDGQAAETGSRAGRPLAVRLRPAASEAVAGRPVVWEVAEGTAGARLSADTVLSDQAGEARVLLTVGADPGAHRVRAFVAEPFASDTALLTVSALGDLGTGVRIDSVVPTVLVEGERATVFGEGFIPTEALHNEVTLDGVRGFIRSGDGTRLEFDVPVSGCLPARRGSLRVFVGGGETHETPSNALVVEVRPARPALRLAPGESRRLAPAEAGCLLLEEADESAELLLAAQNAGRDEGGSVSGLLAVRSAARLDPLPPAAALLPLAFPTAASQVPELRALELETRLREAARREAVRSGARPLPPSPPGGGLAAPAGGPPEPGDTIPFAFAVQAGTLEVSCTDTAAVIAGVVRRAGPRALVVVDARAPRDGFTEVELDLLSAELEGTTLPVTYEWFGEPADVDGNGRVILLLTPEVNRLTPRGSGAILAGFFLLLDLLDSGDGDGDGLTDESGESCPTSNEAEIVYLPVPDPNGDFADPFLRDRALANARGISVHEVQHLISAERRLVLGGADVERQEETWLAEGMSHIAEEVSGLAVAGAATGRNLALSDLSGSREEAASFRAFHFQNFARLRLHMVSPETTPALTLEDPLGFPGLQMRGFAWILLRWLADAHAPGDEAALFRRLAEGGPEFLAGIASLEAAVGRPWEELLAGLSLALAADDHPEGRVQDAGVTTWNLRRAFAQLQAEPGNERLFPPEGYPLAVARLPATATGIGLELGASTARYFRLAREAGSAAAALELLSPAGAPLPAQAGVQVVVGRLR